MLSRIRHAGGSAMTNELIAILGTGISGLGSIGAVWFSMQREIGAVRSEVSDVRLEMAGLNSRAGRIEGILSVVVASHTPLAENPASKPS